MTAQDDILIKSNFALSFLNTIDHIKVQAVVVNIRFYVNHVIFIQSRLANVLYHLYWSTINSNSTLLVLL